MALFDFFKENQGTQESTGTAPAGGAATGTAAPAQSEGATTGADDPVFKKVHAIIEELRPYLQSDGGDVELLKIEDSTAFVRLVGACVGCPSSLMTLRSGVENRIIEAVPEIKAVEMI